MYGGGLFSVPLCGRELATCRAYGKIIFSYMHGNTYSTAFTCLNLHGLILTTIRARNAMNQDVYVRK